MSCFQLTIIVLRATKISKLQSDGHASQRLRHNFVYCDTRQLRKTSWVIYRGVSECSYFKLMRALTGSDKQPLLVLKQFWELHFTNWVKGRKIVCITQTTNNKSVWFEPIFFLLMVRPRTNDDKLHKSLITMREVFYQYGTYKHTCVSLI